MDLKCILMASLLVLMATSSAESAKILLLPAPGGSHGMNFIQISKALMSRGHIIHAYINLNCTLAEKMKGMNITIHGFTSREGCIPEKDNLNRDICESVMNTTFLKFQQMRIRHGDMFKHEAEDMLGQKETIEILKKEKFDLSILDGMVFFKFMYILPYKLDIPVVTFIGVFQPLNAGIPALPSFTPYMIYGKSSNEMTFTERLINTLKTILMERLFLIMDTLSVENLIEEFAPEKPVRSYHDLLANSKLWLVMNDITLDYPQVSLPHVINIGGINTKPAQPLPQDLQEIADNAKDGLILVSFGTHINYFTDHIWSKLISELKQIKQTIIMKHKGEPPEGLPPNIHFRKWLPQNDLLGHPNTKVFVTHAGANSQFEALYHAVPVVSLPLFGDQEYNAIRMAQKGLGISLHMLRFQEGDIVSAVNEILTNRSYSSAMMKQSEMFKDRPLTPLDTMVHWIEHLFKYGADHLISPAVHLPWYSYWCIDVLLCIFFVLLIVFYMLFALLRCMCRCCKCSRKSSTKEKIN